ncbi:uncharacterized protein LOC110724140 [Chenopodium quinoa]|uniref:uncharacterized protein LOC110724140 n=1 Tax=Chenopodium quinoa TaxID=63459 RepID=UPI000B76D5A4|nr:uncharacterized protein LOC110724140 [Chenopodium quinoa]
MDASTIGSFTKSNIEYKNVLRRPTIDNETHGEGAGRTQEERAYCPNDDYSKKIGYLGRLNIDGKGMMWDKKKSRIGAWQQQFIDKAISANRRPDGTFGAAEDLEDRLTGNREPLIKRPRWQHFPSFSTESSGSALDSMDYKKAKNGAGFKCPPETISRWRSCRTGDATEMRPEGEAPKESANTRRISRNKAPSKRIPTSPEDTIRNSPAATNLPRRSPRNKDPAVTISRTGDAAEMRPEGEAPQESAPKRRSSGNKALSERIPMSPADTIQNSPTTTNIPRRSPRIKNPAMMISKQKRC